MSLAAACAGAVSGAATGLRNTVTGMVGGGTQNAGTGPGTGVSTGTGGSTGAGIGSSGVGTDSTSKPTIEYEDAVGFSHVQGQAVAGSFFCLQTLVYKLSSLSNLLNLLSGVVCHVPQ